MNSDYTLQRTTFLRYVFTILVQGRLVILKHNLAGFNEDTS